jgi:hypothetical protein
MQMQQQRQAPPRQEPRPQGNGHRRQ